MVLGNSRWLKIIFVAKLHILQAPSGLVVDDFGTVLVVDTRNQRLQLLDADFSYAGQVKVASLC